MWSKIQGLFTEEPHRQGWQRGWGVGPRAVAPDIRKGLGLEGKKIQVQVFKLKLIFVVHFSDNEIVRAYYGK